MREVPINYLMVLVAAIVNMGIGFLWYSPVLFVKPWMKLTGLDKAKMEKDGMKNFPKIMIVSFASAWLMVFCLRHSVVYGGEYNNMSGVPLGLMTGFFTWLGFVMPVQLTAVLFERQPFKLFLIHTGHQFISFLAMGVVLSL